MLSYGLSRPVSASDCAWLRLLTAHLHLSEHCCRCSLSLQRRASQSVSYRSQQRLKATAAQSETASRPTAARDQRKRPRRCGVQLTRVAAALLRCDVCRGCWASHRDHLCYGSHFRSSSDKFSASPRATAVRQLVRIQDEGAYIKQVSGLADLDSGHDTADRR